jgi:hypothetical protein
MARRKPSDDTEALSARIAVLEAICAEACQAVGAAGAPARVFDQLWAAAQGAPDPARNDPADPCRGLRRGRLARSEIA